MLRSVDAGATVTIGDRTYELREDESFTFGRSDECTVRLSPEDRGISRLAGSIERDGGTWWVLNRSSVRPLGVVDQRGFRRVLAPGRRQAVEAPLRVVVDGAQSSHALLIDVPRAGAP
jgi:hypothetical protein